MPIRNRADEMTIAYVAIGAKVALIDHHERKRPFDSDRFEGELGYIQQVVEHSLVLDVMADAIDWNHGVFVYDVAETFGERYGYALLNNTNETVGAIADKIFEESMA